MSKSKEQLFQTDLEYRTYRIKHLAQKHNWKIANDDGKECQFENAEGAILKINYVDLNIQTALTHPKWGNTVLIREGAFTQKLVESIFRNPREHMPEDIKSKFKPTKKPAK